MTSKKRGGFRVGAGRPSGQGKYKEQTTTMRIPESVAPLIRAYLDQIKLLRSKSATYTPKNVHLLPLFTNKISAGRATQAEPDIEEYIDLDDFLVDNPATTFCVYASGDSMENAGIYDGDLLVVDSSLLATSGKIIIASIDGELTVKRLKIDEANQITLIAENPIYKNITIRENNNFIICGVVTNSIHKL